MNDTSPPPQVEPECFWQEPGSQFPVFRQKDKLYLSEGAELPAAICINCGKPSAKVVRKALRNPYNPLSWIGPKPRVRVGLCSQHTESYIIARTLAFSLLGVGLILFIVGIVNMAFESILVGGVTMALCGLFRSIRPIWSPNVRVEPMEICGAGTQFLANYPDVDLNEECEDTHLS